MTALEMSCEIREVMTTLADLQGYVDNKLESEDQLNIDMMEALENSTSSIITLHTDLDLLQQLFEDLG